MDSPYKHRILSSFNLPNLGIIVEISDVEKGLKKEMVLKSVSLGLYWEVQARIIHSSEEKRFDGETETFSHVNIREINELKNQKKDSKNSFEYCLKPIGHDENPIQDDYLVFSTTIARPDSLRIIDIYEDYFLLDIKNGNTGVLHKDHVLKAHTALIGNYVRHCEHKFHDLVDEDGDFIYERK